MTGEKIIRELATEIEHYRIEFKKYFSVAFYFCGLELNLLKGCDDTH